VQNANMVNTAADCSCRVTNLPSEEAEINSLMPKDECNCHGIWKQKRTVIRVIRRQPTCPLNIVLPLYAQILEIFIELIINFYIHPVHLDIRVFLFTNRCTSELS
jgi:hypothetical protein